MSHPEPIMLELSASQYVALEPFFEHVAAEHAAGRTGMLVAQIGFRNRTHMKVGFLPSKKAKQFAVGSGWTASLESPSPETQPGDPK